MHRYTLASSSTWCYPLLVVHCQKNACSSSYQSSASVGFCLKLGYLLSPGLSFWARFLAAADFVRHKLGHQKAEHAVELTAVQHAKAGRCRFPPRLTSGLTALGFSA